MSQVHNSRVWLLTELRAESGRNDDDASKPGAVREQLRTVQLSELEAFALLLLTIDLELSGGVDGYTHDIARHLVGILRARLE